MKKLLGIVLMICLLGGVPAFATDEAEEFAQANAIRYAYVEQVRSTFARLKEEHGFDYEVSEAVVMDSPDSPAPIYTCDIYAFGDEISAYTTFYATTMKPDTESFTIVFDNKRVAGKTIKDALTATMMLVDGSLDLEQAQAETNKLVLSFDGTGRSIVFTNKGCKIFVYNNPEYGNTCIAMRPIKDYEYILPDEARAKFRPVTYAELFAPLNTGEWVRVTAVPIKQEQGEYELFGFTDIITLQFDEGTIEGKMAFGFRPIEFELDGSAYTFYGSILDGEYTGTGTISLMHVEKVS